jgi:hypothetical protein
MHTKIKGKTGMARYNLTIEDSLGSALEKTAELSSTETVKVSALDLIKKAVINQFGKGSIMNIELTKPTRVKMKPMRGHYIETELEYILLPLKEKGEETFMHPNCASDQIVIPKKVGKSILKLEAWQKYGSKTFETDYYSRYSAIKKIGNNDVFLVSIMKDAFTDYQMFIQGNILEISSTAFSSLFEGF